MDSLQFLSKIRHIPLVSLKLVEGLLAGNYRSVFRGPGLEFDEVRDYTHEDDSRFIDWNVTSRMDSPYIKTFKEERELVMFLVVDVSASMRSGSGKMSREDTAAVLSVLLAHAAIENNDRVGALFYSDGIEHWVPPLKGRKHISRLIADMQEITPKGKGSGLDLAIRTVQESLKRRSICVILSDFRTSRGWQELTLLSRKHDVIAIKISDPDDRRFPDTGLMYLQDPETGRVIPSLGKSGNFRKEHHDFWATQEIFWLRECRRRGIDTLTVSTNDDPVMKLISYFKRRKRR
ncbi:MAG: DUF58 domain-containing protein [Spirochaetales bacterium]|nr:DUF58 domain-containing protein [Spirochaetales bacterium]